MTKVITTRVITIRYEAPLDAYLNNESELESREEIIDFEKSDLIDLGAFLDDIIDEQVTVEFLED